jgi:hypothetical protein
MTINNQDNVPKGTGLWDLDYYRFTITAALGIAVLGLFELLGNSDLKLDRDMPLGLTKSPFSLTAMQELQVSLVFYVTGICVGATVLFVEFLARRALEDKSSEIQEKVIAEGPFESFLNSISGVAVLSSLIGLGFRLGAVHVWYGRGFAIVTIIMIIAAFRGIAIMKRQIERVKPHEIQPAPSTQSQISLALVFGALLLLAGVVGSIFKRNNE